MLSLKCIWLVLFNGIFISLNIWNAGDFWLTNMLIKWLVIRVGLIHLEQILTDTNGLAQNNIPTATMILFILPIYTDNDTDFGQAVKN